MSGFPIVVGRCTLDLAPGGFLCKLQTAPPSVIGSAGPNFGGFAPSQVAPGRSPGELGLVRLSRYVQLFASPMAQQVSTQPPAAMLLPPTAVAPTLIEAVNAAALALAFFEGGPLPFNSADDAVVLIQATFALSLAAAVASSGYVPNATPFPVPIVGLYQQ